MLGLVALARHQYVRARSLFEHGRQLAEQYGPRPTLAIAYHNLASVSYGERDLDGATRMYRQARALFEQDGDAYGAALSDLYLGLIAVEADRHEDAAVRLREALPVFRRMHFHAVRLAVHRRDRCRRAGTRAAAGGDAAVRGGERAPQPRRDRTDRRHRLWEREQTAARADLGEASFATAWAEGLALRDEEALDRAQLAVSG